MKTRNISQWLRFLLKSVNEQSNNIDVIDMPEGRVWLQEESSGSGLHGDVD